MKLSVYTIFDEKAMVYNKPFFLLNDDVCHRTMLDLVNNPETDIAKHPEDFILFKIGEYDDGTGVITNIPNAKTMYRFIDIQNQNEPEVKLTPAGEKYLQEAKS
ncbi:hypothetical protein CV717_28670 [Bacillus cereus]|nr:hypothetical protein CV717_28670 [Bacillus cereus]